MRLIFVILQAIFIILSPIINSMPHLLTIMKVHTIMKILSVLLISWIMCFSASAEVTTVFDFAAGPESGIGMPDGVSWPDDGFVETAKEATFRIEDISIRTTYTGSSSKIYKDADGEVWYYRLYKGCKVSFMCTDDNIIKVSMTFIQNRDSAPSTVSIAAGGGSISVGNNSKSLVWTGNNPAVTLNTNGVLFIDRIEVVTDKQASLSDTVVSDNAEYSAVYYDLQGQKVDNPSGGVFIMLSNGKAMKTYIP